MINENIRSVGSAVDHAINEKMDMQDYPLVLKVHHIAHILGISNRMAYELMERTGFPLIRLGRCKRAPRDAFFQWLNKQMV